MTFDQWTDSERYSVDIDTLFMYQRDIVLHCANLRTPTSKQQTHADLAKILESVLCLREWTNKLLQNLTPIDVIQTEGT